MFGDLHYLAIAGRLYFYFCKPTLVKAVECYAELILALCLFIEGNLGQLTDDLGMGDNIAYYDGDFTLTKAFVRFCGLMDITASFIS